MILGPGAGWPARSAGQKSRRRQGKSRRRGKKASGAGAPRLRRRLFFPHRRLFRQRARPRTFRGRTPGPEIFFYLVIPLQNPPLFSYSAYPVGPGGGTRSYSAFPKGAAGA